MKKILTFIVNDNKEILLLHNNYSDPSHGGDIWYTVTGAVEKEDVSLEDAVKREVKEETNLEVLSSLYLNVVCNYINRNKEYMEYVFVSFVNKNQIILNEEWIDYKWLSLDEFIKQCYFYYDKKILKNILKLAIDKQVFYKKELKLK